MAAQALESLHILVMAGGSGSRFWPKSRERKPKQLLALWDKKTLIEHTLERFEGWVPQENIWIVTTASLHEPLRETLGHRFDRVRILAEPMAKNTAPCILWSLHEIQEACPDALVAIMPADHYIGDEPAFMKSLNIALNHAKTQHSLVTLGIKPTRPETAYGYIELNHVMTLQDGAIPVKQFVEKPDLRTALRYIESGQYLWNAGMFILRAGVGIEAYRKTMPRLASLFDEGDGHAEKIYGSIMPADAVSIDYGVMERATSKGISVAVVPVDCGWNDVGSFTALEEINRAEVGEVVCLDANCNVVQSDHGLVALLGVNDIVVVRDGDVVLVAAKDRAQDIKLLLEKVKATCPEQL